MNILRPCLMALLVAGCQILAPAPTVNPTPKPLELASSSVSNPAIPVGSTITLTSQTAATVAANGTEQTIDLTDICLWVRPADAYDWENPHEGDVVIVEKYYHDYSEDGDGITHVDAILKKRGSGELIPCEPQLPGPTTE